jgi:hypothetical protein
MKSITISHPDWGVCSTQFQPHRHWEPVEQLLGLRAILKAASAPPTEKMIMWAEAIFPIEIPSAQYRTSRQVTPLTNWRAL